MGLLSFLGVILSGFILFTKEIPNEIMSALVKIIERVFWLRRRKTVRSARDFVVSAKIRRTIKI